MNEAAHDTDEAPLNADAFVTLLDALDALREAFELENDLLAQGRTRDLPDVIAVKAERAEALERARTALSERDYELDDDAKELLEERINALQVAVERNARLSHAVRTAVGKLVKVARRAMQSQNPDLYGPDGSTSTIESEPARVDAEF